ncbi:ribosomal RNA processing protein 1 [Pelomyxa schiedti]|nr:ribosomal RNA processing protein 1 [Pelomyxa schiedti]
MSGRAKATAGRKVVKVAEKKTPKSGGGEEGPLRKKQIVGKIGTDELKQCCVALAHSTSQSERDRAVGAVRKLIRSNVASFTDIQFGILWRGFYFCIWHADKVPYQQKLMRLLAQMTSLFNTTEQSMKFTLWFFRTIQTEWKGIDKWRIDKYMSIVRFMMEESLQVIGNHQWDIQLAELWVSTLIQGLTTTGLEIQTKPKGGAKAPQDDGGWEAEIRGATEGSLVHHIADIFWETLTTSARRVGSKPPIAVVVELFSAMVKLSLTSVNGDTMVYIGSTCFIAPFTANPPGVIAKRQAKVVPELRSLLKRFSRSKEYSRSRREWLTGFISELMASYTPEPEPESEEEPTRTTGKRRKLIMEERPISTAEPTPKKPRTASTTTTSTTTTSTTQSPAPTTPEDTPASTGRKGKYKGKALSEEERKKKLEKLEKNKKRKAILAAKKKKRMAKSRPRVHGHHCH